MAERDALQPWDGGYCLTVDQGDGRYRVIVPRELLDDEVGDDRTEEASVAWIEERMPQIMQAYTARTEGGWLNPPFNRIYVEEAD